MDGLTTVKLLQQTLDYAVACGASDVHLTEFQGKLHVQFRVSGAVRPYVHFTSRGDEVIRRIKALGRMDVTDRLSMQEGSFSWELDQMKIRVRVSAVPVYGGESVVLRLLYERTDAVELQHIGMSADQLAQTVQILREPCGLVVVSGRTGVGKTTTLYAMMKHLASLGRQVFSIEDPVEVPLDTCRQIEVREKSGVTYEAGLRALLRQDPDVLMIGEIRDEVTAQVALRATLTGRLVLATTHAHDEEMTIARLVDLGIRKDWLDDVLRAIIVQTWPMEFSNYRVHPLFSIYQLQKTRPSRIRIAPEGRDARADNGERTAI